MDAEEAQRFLAVQTEIARIEAERALATARDSSVEQFGDFGGLTSEGFRAAAEQLGDLDRQIAAVQARRAEMLASDEGGAFIDIERELADLVNARQILGRVDGDIRRLQGLLASRARRRPGSPRRSSPSVRQKARRKRPLPRRSCPSASPRHRQFPLCQ